MIKIQEITKKLFTNLKESNQLFKILDPEIIEQILLGINKENIIDIIPMTSPYEHGIGYATTTNVQSYGTSIDSKRIISSFINRINKIIEGGLIYEKSISGKEKYCIFRPYVIPIILKQYCDIDFSGHEKGKTYYYGMVRYRIDFVDK